MRRTKMLFAGFVGLLLIAPTVVGVRGQSPGGMADIISARAEMIIAKPLLGVFNPTEESCTALSEAWAKYGQKRNQAHTVCLKAMSESKTVPDPVTGCDVLECGEFHGPGPGQDEVNECFAEARRRAKEQQDEEARKKKEEADAEAKKKAAAKNNASSTSEDTSKRDSDRSVDRDEKSSDKSDSKSSDGERKTLTESLADMKQSLRDAEEKRLEAQRKADERRLDRAAEESKLEQAKLQERTAERDEQKAKLEAERAGVDARLAGETSQLTNKQADLVSLITNSTPKLSTDLGDVAKGGSSVFDFDLGGISVKDVGESALSMVTMANKAIELKVSVEEFFSSMNRGPLVNWDRERVRILAKQLDVPEYIAAANVEYIYGRQPNVDAPGITPPRWLSNLADTIDTVQTPFEAITSISDVFSSMGKFISGPTPADRARGFLDTLAAVPDAALSTGELFAATPSEAAILRNSFLSEAMQARLDVVQGRILLPLITVNQAADALNGALGEGVNQFASGIQVFLTYGGDPSDIGDFNAVGRATFRNMPYLGGIIRASEYWDRTWDRLRFR